MTKILVIEDDPQVRDVIVDILDAEDFSPFSAQDGQSGLTVVRENRPDLIICDVMMPEMDGYEVLERLRHDPDTATIPFIFLTAKSEKLDIRRGMELGADDYLTKPFTREELLGTISTRLNRQATLQEQSQQKLEDLRTSISFSLPHGLRTPLQAILRDAHLLINDYAVIQPDELLGVAESIYGSAQRLHRLMQNFLLIAELEVLELSPDRLKTLRRQRIGYSHAVIQAAAQAKAQEYGRDADLQLDLQELPVQMSESMLKKIATELLDNAFKFSEPGDPVQVISSHQDGQFTFYVIDQGRGFLPGQTEEVGPYIQFEADTYGQDGVGLGLAVAKRLVELHQGQLHIESIPSKQTMLRISLPTSA